MPLHDISDPACPLPDILILDASLLLQLPLSRPQGTTTPKQQAISNFLKRISNEATAGRMLCAAPAITLEECYFKLIQFRYSQDLPNHQTRLLQDAPGRKRVSWHDLYKDSPQLIQSYMPDLHNFRSAILGIPTVILEPEDLGAPPPALEPRMFHYIEHVPILPKDAYLLAIADRLDVPHIATMDADFRSVSGWLNIYTYI